jgi:uncharacterized membrane protein
MPGPWRGGSWAAAAALALLWPSCAWGAGDAPAMLRLAGRLHPVLVHFPIALVLTAAALEVVRALRRRTCPSDAAVLCLVLGAIGAATAAGAGWLNADYEPHGRGVAQTIKLHRWLGISTACVATAAAVLAVLARRFPGGRPGWWSWAMGLCAAGLVSATAYFGVSLTYGTDHFTAAFEDPARTIQAALPAPGGLSAFDADIRPIFASNCYKCHGPEKQKGGLRLDLPSSWFAGDEADWVIRPGDADGSELVRRVTLPPDDEDHMPPKGKVLPPEAVERIKRWIDDGAGVGIARP